MAGLPYFGRKIKLSEKAISCSSGPPPTLSTTLPTAGPATGCVSDLRPQNPCCALRSRNRMDQRVPQGSPSCSLILQITQYETPPPALILAGAKQENGLEKAVAPPPQPFSSALGLEINIPNLTHKQRGLDC